jgi:extracellular factor (EF) 3-hydroxypalmitic acid methyl ester biosynthesis protein
MKITVESALDSFCGQIQHNAFGTIQEIEAYLDAQKQALNGGWSHVAAQFRMHPLHRLLLEDPHASRAFQKPRGYAGDAVMMDFIYHHPSVAEEMEGASRLGRSMCRWSAGDSGPAKAVRWRRQRVAKEIERLADERGSIEVLAFACGHLREFELVRPEVRKQVRFVAADADEASLEAVRQSYCSVGAVDCMRISVRELVGRRIATPGTFDFVYTLGLLDYVSARTSGRLVDRLWALVRPGGAVMAGNFTTSTRGSGYLEAVMDWWLCYRDTAEVTGWAGLLDNVSEREVFTDPYDQIAYLLAHKRLW